MSSVDSLSEAPVAAGSQERAVSVERCALGPVSPKIQRTHLDRLAMVYVRQSTPHQVLEYHESRSRQYALSDCAVKFGWSRDRILLVDEDQGQSGQSAEARVGFQRLLMEVTLDHVGIVLGLEMSRLARSNKDWHHLLELCAIFGTLLADQDGVYDPTDPNDRLLLGLKGTISELEIHTMRNRLEKGKLNKAQRGEVFFGLPIGYVKTPTGELALDPDEQVRAVVALIFDKFDELGSACSVFRYLLGNGIRVGVRCQHGPNKDQLEWRRPCLPTIFKILHHPFYAGTYAYGRCVVDAKRRHTGGRNTGRKWLPMDQWKVMLHDQVPAYITRDRYLRIQERLLQNRSRLDASGTPRQGAALLSGILFCGRCGTRMRACYSRSQQPRYECLRHKYRGLERACHGIPAETIDSLVVQQVLRALEPAALDLSLRAGEDIQRERERLGLHWKQQLQRAQYESGKAERHYRAVDPENRLVARTLEQQWEKALRQRQQLQEEYDRFLQKAPAELTAQEKDLIRTLATDIPSLWIAPTTTDKDRKEVIRCVLERVDLSVQGNTEYVDVVLHWAGGCTSQHLIMRPIKGYVQLRDHDRLIERTRELRQSGHSAAQIAERLNEEGFHPAGRRSRFDHRLVRQLLPRWRMSGGLDDEHILGSNEWRLGTLARKLRIHPSKLRRWARLGWVRARRPHVVWCYIVWADQEELKRLTRMRDHSKNHPFAPYPDELKVAPAGRPGADRHRAR